MEAMSAGQPRQKDKENVYGGEAKRARLVCFHQIDNIVQVFAYATVELNINGVTGFPCMFLNDQRVYGLILDKLFFFFFLVG